MHVMENDDGKKGLINDGMELIHFGSRTKQKSEEISLH